MKKVILITGTTGMLGSVLKRELKKKFQVIASSFDITSRSAILQERTPLDLIIHCAAMTDVNMCEQNKVSCRKVNVKGTANILELARRNHADFIYISTPMVFDGKHGNYRESDTPRPLNHYAKTKVAAEKLVRAYSHGLVIRANPIGIRPKGAHPSFVQWFVSMAQTSGSFTLFSDVVINPISTDTFARQMLLIIDVFRPGILHLGSATRANKAEIWNLIARHYPQFSGTVLVKPLSETLVNRIAKRPRLMWLNVKKSMKRGLPAPTWEKEVKIVLRELLRGRHRPSLSQAVQRRRSVSI